MNSSNEKDNNTIPSTNIILCKNNIHDDNRRFLEDDFKEITSRGTPISKSCSKFSISLVLLLLLLFILFLNGSTTN